MLKDSYPIYPNGTFRLKNKGIFTIGLFVAEKNIAYLAIWKINTEESKFTFFGKNIRNYIRKIIRK